MKAVDIQNSCQCHKCQTMCQHPCWPTPDEAKAIIDAGYGPRLRADYWRYKPNACDVLVLSGSLAGREGEIKPPWPSNGHSFCTFYRDGLCELHDKNLKPLEGALAHHDGGPETGPLLHKKIALMWDNPEAQKLANEWVSNHGVEMEHEEPPTFLDLLFRHF